MARTTRQRAAVRAVFQDLDGFHSAQEVHARLRAAGDPVGLSTVYRAVQSLADDGELDSIRTDSGEALYRRCSPQHHHHLVCRGCGLTVEVAGPAVEQWADRIAGEHGFADISHTLEIFGTCAACRAAGAGSDEVADPAVGLHVDQQQELLAVLELQGERGDVAVGLRAVDQAVEGPVGESPPAEGVLEEVRASAQAGPSSAAASVADCCTSAQERS